MPPHPFETPRPHGDQPHSAHQAAIHLDEWEDGEYRPIDTITVKGDLL